jgi:regulatory protein
VDDFRCAGYVLDAWRRKKVYGRQYLRLMLQRRCLSGEPAREVLHQVTDQEETERAEELARQQMAKLKRKYGDEPRKGKAALARMLASRGFGTGPIASALELWNRDEEELY